jgi:hypothetical protein
MDDPRTDDRTSAIRSHLLNTLSRHMQALSSQNVPVRRMVFMTGYQLQSLDTRFFLEEEDSVEGIKELIVEEVKVHPEARSNQSRQCVS